MTATAPGQTWTRKKTGARVVVEEVSATGKYVEWRALCPGFREKHSGVTEAAKFHQLYQPEEDA